MSLIFMLFIFNFCVSVVNFNFHDTTCLEGSTTCMILNLFCALWYSCNSLTSTTNVDDLSQHLLQGIDFNSRNIIW